MFAGVSFYEKSGHHDLYNFRLLCHTGRVKDCMIATEAEITKRVPPKEPNLVGGQMDAGWVSSRTAPVRLNQTDVN
jgi:hypothetical protein